jgi:cytochrome c oxidase subunit II
MLNPRGPAAAEIAILWWIIFGLGMAVFTAVTVLFLYGSWTRARSEKNVTDTAVDLSVISGAPWLLWGGVIIPFVILMGAFFFGLRTLSATRTPPEPAAVTIEVIGHRWWWEVRYPDYDIISANEIVIPAGYPVQLVLTSSDVIHSFWVPQLHGKQDMTPGRVDTFWLQADEPGIYRGLCAEFCGLQHANMQILVVAEQPDDFNAWLARERQPAAPPTGELASRGQQVFVSAACVYCHTVRGTAATGIIGPDLTHLASRRSLAAGIIENNPGHLAGWIVDPQNIKPGNLMPPTNLTAEDLQALLAYLASLE